jgi:phage terminase small subunit
MPQNQKSDAFRVGELPDLTSQQEAFVKGILDGKTASDAYRAAYDCSQMLANTVWASASRLRHHHKVDAWLQAARLAKLGTAKVTLDDHLTELERLREMAAASGNYGAAVNAEVSRGKAAGHYVERVANVTAENDVMATLKEIATIDPTIGEALAAKYGITIDTATKH